jgi:hypothetical protein
MLGINIGLMTKLFPNRDYKNLKNKFKSEEKNNPDRIEKAVASHIPFDPAYFSGDSGTILHSFFRIFLIILSVFQLLFQFKKSKQVQLKWKSLTNQAVQRRLILLYLLEAERKLAYLHFV